MSFLNKILNGASCNLTKLADFHQPTSRMDFDNRLATNRRSYTIDELQDKEAPKSFQDSEMITDMDIIMDQKKIGEIYTTINSDIDKSQSVPIMTTTTTTTEPTPTLATEFVKIDMVELLKGKNVINVDKNVKYTNKFDKYTEEVLHEELQKRNCEEKFCLCMNESLKRKTKRPKSKTVVMNCVFEQKPEVVKKKEEILGEIFVLRLNNLETNIIFIRKNI